MGLAAELVSGRGADCRSPLEQQPQSQPLNWLLMGRKVHQQSVNSKSISERLDFGSCGEKGGQPVLREQILAEPLNLAPLLIQLLLFVSGVRA